MATRRSELSRKWHLSRRGLALKLQASNDTSLPLCGNQHPDLPRKFIIEIPFDLLQINNIIAAVG